MTFAQWLDQLDELAQADSEMSHHDLPDTRLRDAYARGLQPGDFSPDASHMAPHIPKESA